MMYRTACCSPTRRRRPAPTVSRKNGSATSWGSPSSSLARAVAEAAPDAPLPDVRDATLTLLYRLLFILYAEDRELLPVRDERYDDYGLRMNVRDDVRKRKDRNDAFSATATRYWSAIDDLATAIDRGDASIGLPPYNGGLFNRERTPLLADVRLGDQLLADVIDTLSFEQSAGGRRYINYRDLSVQQLGSIYERLLERELVRDGETIVVRPNVFARKGSGSYFTPHDLVNLILEETIGPLVQARLDAFARAAEDFATRGLTEQDRIATLERFDPAERILDLRICDPAMGSGHFLVGLVDYLADRVISLMAESEAMVEGYASPLTRRIDDVRRTIIDNARERGWTVDPDRLDDRHLVRRIVLKRCVYGVDRNPMAVELAKVSLWLHTFTAGAPLSFLDHHLRCGNSLFGCWARNAFDTANRLGSPLFLHEPLNRATRAAMSMQTIEELTDAEITQADQSAGLFDDILEMTAPLDAFLSLVHAFEWLNVRDADGRTALRQYFQSAFGDPVRIATGEIDVAGDSAVHERFAQLLDEARRIVADERFFNWQPAFPSVWTDWDAAQWRGGFDAVIGNPPWDRMKLQQVEWFAYRRSEIARAPRAADRKRMITALRNAADPLADGYELAADPPSRPSASRGNAETIRCSREATSTSIPCSSNERSHSSSRKASWGCSYHPGSRPTRPRLVFSRAWRPKAGCGRCTISRTERSSSRTCTHRSNSACSWPDVRPRRHPPSARSTCMNWRNYRIRTGASR